MPRVPRGRFALAFLASCAVLAAGCGEGSDSSDPGSSALGSPDVQTSARETDCLDWNRASAEEQQVIVESIAEFERGATTGTLGRTLPDEQAHDLFERVCERERAGAFKLYKSYVRAAAFTEQP